MRKLTPEQEAAKQKRESREQSPSAGKATPAAPLAFEEAVAGGIPVQIDALELDIAPFFLSGIPKAARLLVQCPEILVTHAVANKDSEDFDLARTTATINRNRDEADQATPEAVAQTLASVGSRMTEEEASAMLDLIHLAAMRRSPEVTREQLDEAMNIPAFLILLRAVLRENPNLADPFNG